MARKADTIKTTISDFVREAAQADRAAALTFFLAEQGQSSSGSWDGYMSAADQRALFGMKIGMGRIWVDGAKEVVGMTVKQCYGMDFSVEVKQPWSAFVLGKLVNEGGYYVQDGRAEMMA